MKKYLIVFIFFFASFNSFCQDFDPILCEQWLKNAYTEFLDKNPCEDGYYFDDPYGPTIQTGYKDGLYIHIRKLIVLPPPFFTFYYESEYYDLNGNYLGDEFEGDFEENEELLYSCSDPYPACESSCLTCRNKSNSLIFTVNHDTSIVIDHLMNEPTQGCSLSFDRTQIIMEIPFKCSFLKGQTSALDSFWIYDLVNGDSCLSFVRFVNGGYCCTPFTPCNDNNPCTIYDYYDQDCNCIGKLISSNKEYSFTSTSGENIVMDNIADSCNVYVFIFYFHWCKPCQDLYKSHLPSDYNVYPNLKVIPIMMEVSEFNIDSLENYNFNFINNNPFLNIVEGGETEYLADHCLNSTPTVFVKCPNKDTLAVISNVGNMTGIPIAVNNYIELNCTCNPSSKVQIALPSQSVKYQDTFSIPVVVTGFQDILSFQFPITWDTTELEIIQVHSLNKTLPDYTVQNNNVVIRKGEIKTIYYTAFPFSLNTFDTLFSIQFKAKSQGCDYSFVSLPHVINYPAPAPSFEIKITDKNSNSLTYITTDAYITIQKAFYQSFSICSSETVQVGSNTYNLQGTYIDTLQSSIGCDSIVTTTITHKPGSAFFQEVQICQGESITVGSNTYTMQGTYIDTFRLFIGCDSIVTTTITLKPVAVYSQEIQICQGESFSVGNNTYTMQGMYIDTLQSSIGCDSIVTTTISYKPKTSYSQEIQICQGESISVGNNTYTMQGMYIDTLQSSIGCDSIVATTITFKPDATYSQEIQICQGESITVGTKSYTVSGSYVDTLIAKNGCDSIVQTYLNVRQTQVTDDIIVICSGQSHFVASNIYTQSGNYIDTLQSIYGCDSIINTFLTVRSSKNKAIPIADTITLCLKDTIINPYSFLDQYEANGTWTLDEKNISGEPFNLKELPEGIHTINYGFFQQSPCPDNDTSFILVVKDCSIMDCSFMVKDDSIRVNKNESSEISLTINDILPEEYIISIISVNPEILESTNLSDQGLYSFTVTGDFGEIVQVVYEICTPDCADCKQGSLWIDNEALKDIIRTNIILPNTSGKNATLRFTDDEILLDSELYIFNRNGDRIFYMKDYDNSWNADGYPGGIYYYVLRYRGVDVKKTLTVMK